MFDEGLWSVDDDFRVLVNSKCFSESGQEWMKLMNFNGRHLQFDPASKLRPAIERIRRHRTRMMGSPEAEASNG
jgi:predicted restriction endonuclease